MPLLSLMDNAIDGNPIRCSVSSLPNPPQTSSSLPDFLGEGSLLCIHRISGTPPSDIRQKPHWRAFYRTEYNEFQRFRGPRQAASTLKVIFAPENPDLASLGGAGGISPMYR